MSQHCDTIVKTRLGGGCHVSAMTTEIASLPRGCMQAHLQVGRWVRVWGMERGCRPAVGRGGEGVGYWGAVAHIIASVRDERQLALLPLLRQPRWRRHKRREQVSTVQRVPVQPFEKRRFRNVRALPHGHHRAVCGHRVEEGSEEGSGPCHRRRAALLAVEGGDHGGRQGDAPTGHVSDRREPPRVAVAGAKQGFFAVGEGSEHLPRGMRCEGV